MWAPGDVLVIDWGQIGPLLVFCAVVAWSRWRFVHFADNQRADTTLAALAACFEALGGVPRTVLCDRMGCLKGGTVAGVVVPTADYVRFATHYGFRPDFCEGADPESKGLVENLVGYVKSDLMVPAELSVDDLVGGQRGGGGVVRRGQRRRSTPRSAPSPPSASSPRPTCSVRCRRCGPGSASWSCARSTGSAASASARPATRCPPATSAARSRSASPTARSRSSCWERSSPPISLIAPGEASVDDDHYGGPRPAPRRAVRPQTAAEKAFCALGPVAEAFIKAAAASGITHARR